MQKLQPPTSNAKKQRTEREIEIGNDYSKARKFPHTIIGRKRLRGLRRALWKINIHLFVPMNSAQYTDEYCKAYSKEVESDALF